MRLDTSACLSEVSVGCPPGASLPWTPTPNNRNWQKRIARLGPRACADAQRAPNFRLTRVKCLATVARIQLPSRSKLKLKSKIPPAADRVVRPRPFTWLSKAKTTALDTFCVSPRAQSTLRAKIKSCWHLATSQEEASKGRASQSPREEKE